MRELFQQVREEVHALRLVLKWTLLRQDFRILRFKTFARNELAETRLEIAAITGGEFDEDEEGEGEEAELQRQIL